MTYQNGMYLDLDINDNSFLEKVFIHLNSEKIHRYYLIKNYPVPIRILFIAQKVAENSANILLSDGREINSDRKNSQIAS